MIQIWMKLYSSNFIKYLMFLVVRFWMTILRLYFHPILDVSCRQFLDEKLHDAYCHEFLDENYN